MGESKHTLAIILNRQSYRDYDSLVVVYSEKFGKLSLIARGTKKLQSKLAGHLEPFNLVNLMIIPGKSRDYVGSALTQTAWLNLKNGLNKLYYVGRAVNLFHRLVGEKELDPNLFLLWCEWLNYLDNNPCDCSKEEGELLLNFFSLKLLTSLGYQPEMYHCLVCHQVITPGHNYFHLQDGGLICSACCPAILPRPELLPVSDNVIKLVRFLTGHNLDRISQLKTDQKTRGELTTFVNSFINFNN